MFGGQIQGVPERKCCPRKTVLDTCDTEHDLPCRISEVYSPGKNIKHHILGQFISFDVLRYFRTLKIGVARTSHVRVAKQQEGYPRKLMTRAFVILMLCFRPIVT